MDDIKQIIKKTLGQLKAKNLLATPDNYFREFTIQSKIAELEISECEIFDNIINKLTNIDQQRIKQQNITTYSQLALFLLEKANNLKDLAFILNEILAPSINHDIELKIEELSIDLHNDPMKLLQRDTLTKIKNITKIRILNDKNVLKNKTSDFKKVSDLMAKYFNRLLLESGNSHGTINLIKEELESLNISDNSQRELARLQGKLIAAVHNIEMSIDTNKEEILFNQTNFIKLEEKITELEIELENKKDENELD